MALTTSQKALVIASAGAAVVGLGLVLFRRRKATAPVAGLADNAPPPQLRERVGRLQDAVWEAVRNPQMRELALAVTGDRRFDVTVNRRRFLVEGAKCPPRDGRCEAEAVGRWVATNQTAAAELVPVGDDSAAALACVLNTLNGVTCRFKVKDGAVTPVYGAPKNHPGQWLAALPGHQVDGKLGDDYPA